MEVWELCARLAGRATGLRVWQGRRPHGTPLPPLAHILGGWGPRTRQQPPPHTRLRRETEPHSVCGLVFAPHLHLRRARAPTPPPPPPRSLPADRGSATRLVHAVSVIPRIFQANRPLPAKSARPLCEGGGGGGGQSRIVVNRSTGMRAWQGEVWGGGGWGEGRARGRGPPPPGHQGIPPCETR